MKRVATVFVLMGVLSFSAFAEKPYRLTKNGVVVSVTDTVLNGAKLVRVEPVTDRIIRVTAINAKTFPTVQSLMIDETKLPPVKWSAVESGGVVVLKTTMLQVRISTRTGALVFCDAEGNPILTELKDGGKMIEPVTLEGKPLFRLRDQFESPSDEAFYGLGQQQEGLFNYKGQDVDLYQYNTKISIPFVVSNRNYGILWDNYSRSKFGDIRDFGNLSPAFKLFGADGKRRRD